MVRVSCTATDSTTAWRIRDELASHPLLGGATASIDVVATYDGVVLTGWTHDDGLAHLAIKLAGRAAGKRVVQPQLRTLARPASR